MNNLEWAKELSCGVTVCDMDAKILFINNKAAATFARFGDNLTGRNLKEFHGERAWAMITEMLAKGSSNSYTIDKQGIKKLIHQTPWFDNGIVSGLVEFSIELPMDMPHHIRG